VRPAVLRRFLTGGEEPRVLEIFDVGTTNNVSHSVTYSPPALGSGLISDATIEAVHSIPLIDIVGAVVSLRRAGKRFIGLCPFHSEKHASFGIDPEKNLWHCFGCGAGGDTVAFIQRLEGCDFRKAVSILAARAGISIEHGTVDRSRLAMRAELRAIDERIKKILNQEQVRCADELGRLREISRTSNLDSLPADVYTKLRRADVRYVLLALQPQEEIEKFLSLSPAEQDDRIDQVLEDSYLSSWEVPLQ
jgi:hypothetical protein